MNFSDYCEDQSISLEGMGVYEKFQTFRIYWNSFLKFIDFREDDDTVLYFEELMRLLDVSHHTACDLWYANQRSWFKPEMAEVIVDMEKNKEKYNYFPILTRGDFAWDSVNRRFIPEN